MFKRRPRSKNTCLVLQSSNRGSDIVKPENTSLIVHESDSDDELPKELTSELLENYEIPEVNRPSSSFLNSLTQKTQSTPKKFSPSPDRVLKEVKKDFTKKKGNKSVTLRTGQNDLGSTAKTSVTFLNQILQECGASPASGDSSYLMCKMFSFILLLYYYSKFFKLH